MKAIALIAIALFGLGACTFKSERTVVERPIAVPASTVVYAESPATTTTVIVPAN